MKHEKPCWIVTDPETGENYYFRYEDEELVRWFQNCRTVHHMCLGNVPVDGGNFFLTQEEAAEAVAREPEIAKYIRQCLGSREFIHSKMRFCLWLVDVKPAEIKKSRFLYDRVSKVKAFRQASSKKLTQKRADSPYLFAEIRQPASKSYLLIPRHSSEKRMYVPMGFVPSDIIALDSCTILPECTFYHFGVLTSRVHMGWMRRVCGRLTSRYRYSNTVVYNTFMWPSANPRQVVAITKTAKAILEIRSKFPESSMADLYDETSMPIELRKAHQANDEAVMKAYGFPAGMSEFDVVGRLFELYEAAKEREESQRRSNYD